MRFFVDASRRLVRTIDDDQAPGRHGMDEQIWREVSSKEYDNFIAETQALFTPAQLRAIRSGGQKFVWLLQDCYDDTPCWLLGASSGVGYVGPICKTKSQAKAWAKDNNYIPIGAK